MFQVWVSQGNSSLDRSLRVHLQLAIRTSEKEHCSVTDTGSLEEKIQVLVIAVELMTFWILVQFLYRRVKGDSWELRPLNYNRFM